MTKLLIALVLLTSYCIPVYPIEKRIKAGYAHSTCEYVEGGYDIAISFEKRYNRLAGELEFGFESHKIRQVGYLNTFKISLFGKVYFTPTIWIGAGGELANNFIRETNHYYKSIINFNRYESYVDNEWRYGASIGKDFKDWFIEARYMLGDLDISSGLPYETGVESSSNLDGISFRVGRKW